MVEIFSRVIIDKQIFISSFGRSTGDVDLLSCHSRWTWHWSRGIRISNLAFCSTVEPVSCAAEICGISRSSAYKIRQEYNQGDGTVLPSGVKKREDPKPSKFNEQHTNFIIKLVDDNPCIVLEQIRDELCLHFEFRLVAYSNT
jgi:hypothetical protein